MKRVLLASALGVATAAGWVGCSTFGSAQGVADASPQLVDGTAETPDAGILPGLEPRDGAVKDSAVVVPPEACDAGVDRNNIRMYENIDPIELKTVECDFAAVHGPFGGELNVSLLTLTNSAASALGFGPGLGATPWLGTQVFDFVAYRDDAGTSLAVADEAGVSVATRIATYPPNGAASGIFGGVLFGERAPWLTKGLALYTAVGEDIYRRPTPTSLRPSQSVARVLSPVLSLAADHTESVLLVTRRGATESTPAVDLMVPACGRWRKDATVQLVGFDSTGFRAVIAATEDRNTLLVARRCTDNLPLVCCLARAAYRP